MPALTNSKAPTLIDFALKWEARLATAAEHGDSHEHFIDLCRVLGVETPNDKGSEDYKFEKKVSKNLRGQGFADVWTRGHFGWEYKSPGKDLKGAYKQLLDYREDPEPSAPAGSGGRRGTEGTETANAHEALQRAAHVADACAREARPCGVRCIRLVSGLKDEEILENLLALNLKRAETT